MYICSECGHIFEEGEERRYTESYGEQLSCCPICGGGYVEAVICESCGGAFHPDDERMVGKWCKDCLLGMVDYEVFKKYLHWSADAGPSDVMSEIEWFFFRDLWGMDDAKVKTLRSSFDCKSDLFSLYDAYTEGDKLDTQFTGKHPFLDKIKAFVSEDLYVFADWLEGEEKMDLYKAFLDYATNGVQYNSEIDTLERFFFIVVWGIGAKDMPKHSSGDMKRTLREIYLREVQNDKLLGRTDFLDKITAFIELEDIKLKGVTE